jgi:Mce-associated membrane protein
LTAGAVLEVTDTAPATEQVVTAPVASWLSRAGALAVDVLFPFGVAAAIGLVALSAVSGPDGSYGSWLWWLSMSVLGVLISLVLINRVLLPAVTGWSLGRSLFGIRVVRSGDDEPIGPWRLLVRDIAHLLDTLSLFVGWLWPLWDSRHRTFADLLLRTEVRRVPDRPANARRLTAAVFTAAALLSAAAAGLNYLVLYQHDRAIDSARDQIRVQGPKIVADMLTYNAGSLQADFAHAQSLTTDAYRPQLVAQQDAVKKAVPTSNEYWAPNSAVLSVSPDRASMLIMLQGQRSASQQEPRFITATVRVSFEKSANGQWRVADLTVLSRPQPNGAGK